LNDTGALVIQTGAFTGRSPKDKFTVKDEITADTVNWNDFNLPIEPKYFDIVYQKMLDYLNNLPELWVRDCYACADPRYRLNIRIVNEKPWTNLFAYNMFLRPTEAELENFEPEWHILSAPELKLDAKECSTRQQNAAIVSFKHKMIFDSRKQAIPAKPKKVFFLFSIIFYHKKKNVLSMHCSANMGHDGDTAIFFGLSGTGKNYLKCRPQSQTNWR
jgi:phosphoenolpyruvate carboxykinase (ATP)